MFSCFWQMNSAAEYICLQSAWNVELNLNIQVSSQELKHHCCLPDLKIKTVFIGLVKTVIQISSGTKNPRYGKLSKASPKSNYQKNQDGSLKIHPNYNRYYSSLDFQQIKNDSQFICQSGCSPSISSIWIFIPKMTWIASHLS